MSLKPHLLIVDDDNRLRKLLKKYLTENGFIVSQAANTLQAKESIALFQFNAYILDVMMPGQSGTDFAQELRQNHNATPILMLTAMDTIDDRITGLESGADDYLAKPFEPKELLLRLNNILKRAPSQNESPYIYFGDCQYNKKTNQLVCNNTPTSLTSGEQNLLSIFIESIDNSISREELAEKLGTNNERAIDVQITRLRKKIERDIKNPICIQTIRGQGYILIQK